MTVDSEEEDITSFYKDLETVLEELPKKDIKIISGDWNAKVGKGNESYENAMGRYGYGDRNERGEKLLEFALKHDMTICNTMFQQKDSRKWTWLAPDGQHKNMIDLILIENRWKTSVRLCRTFQGADVSSDHSLVLCNIRVTLKWSRKKQYNKKKDLQALKNNAVRAEVRKKMEDGIKEVDFRNLNINERVTKLNTIMTQAAEETLPKVVRAKKKWITEETLRLAQEKREERLRALNSNDKSKYKKLCNEVRAHARKDKQEWIDGQCRDIEKHAGQGRTKEVYKLIKTVNNKWQPRQSAIKNKEGKIVLDKESTRKRWTEYCSELYKDQDQENIVLLQKLEEMSPPARNDSMESILYEEVEQAIKRLKDNKSPGADEITAELIKSGGEELAKQIHEICKLVWESGTIPEEWTKSILVIIPKKGDLTDCKNYRTIALLSHMGKVLLTVLLRRLQAQTEDFISDMQAGFRKDRNTVQQILMLRLIAEKAKRKGRLVYNCFIDFQKAFDSVKMKVTWATLKSYGVGSRLIEILRNIGERAKSAVKFEQEIGEWFNITVGTRQGDPLSPSIFITYLERVMDNFQELETGISIQGTKINNLRFADDIDLIEESKDKLQEMMKTMSDNGKQAGLRINIDKTKTMVFGKADIGGNLVIDNNEVENVGEFMYLGSLLTWDNDCGKDIRTRISKAKGVMAGFNTIWKNKGIKLDTKLDILRTCIMGVATYACETWTLKKADRDRLLAFEMYCYRRILRISYTQKITNAEVRRRVNLKRNLLQKVMERKMRLFGHIARMEDNRIIKNVMLGEMDGTGRRGRPAREWMDDIVEWGEKDIQSLYHTAQNRVEWEKVVETAGDTNGLQAQGI